MIVLAILLLAIGIGLSAFFSGSETGFYRASRVRLVMDALEGDGPSQRLLFFINHPSLFVATALVGNNTANYLASLGIVLAAGIAFGAHAGIEILASICFAPVIFVYGELMPKNVFFQAPNRLLRHSANAFSMFAVLFAPLSAVLWGLSRLLEQLLGQSPEKVRLTLARKELGDVLAEGVDAGLLQPMQTRLAHSFFAVATKTVADVMRPLSESPTIDRTASRSQALQMAQQQQLTVIAVKEPDSTQLAGYLRCIDLLVRTDQQSITPFLKPLPKLLQSELFGEAVLQLQATNQQLAQVIDDAGKAIGLVSLDQLIDPLLSGVEDELASAAEEIASAKKTAQQQ